MKSELLPKLSMTLQALGCTVEEWLELEPLDLEFRNEPKKIMIITPPKTIEEFKEVEKDILELMGNPWCDQFMFVSLQIRLDKCKDEILKMNKRKEL